MSEITNRGFLDLENYGSKETIDLLVKKLKGVGEFIERVGDRLYFKFESRIHQANFFAYIRNVLFDEGYATQVIYEPDHYEIKERMLRDKRKSLLETKQKIKKRRIKSNYEKIPRNPRYYNYH